MLAFLFEFLHPDEKDKVTRIRNRLFPDSVQRPPDGATTSSPRELSPIYGKIWRENELDDEEPVLPAGVIPLSSSQPHKEVSLPSDLPTRVSTPETQQRTKRKPRSQLASGSGSVNANARKGKPGHQQPSNRISKKRASPVRSSPCNTKQRATKEPAAPYRYDLRSRPSKEPAAPEEPAAPCRYDLRPRPLVRPNESNKACA